MKQRARPAGRGQPGLEVTYALRWCSLAIARSSRLDGLPGSAQPVRMPGANWHTVDGYGVLLVECRACGRRGAIRKEDSRRQMFQGNMEELNRQVFRCRKCNGTEIRAYFPR